MDAVAVGAPPGRDAARDLLVVVVLGVVNEVTADGGAVAEAEAVDGPAADLRAHQQRVRALADEGVVHAALHRRPLLLADAQLARHRAVGIHDPGAAELDVAGRGRNISASHRVRVSTKPRASIDSPAPAVCLVAAASRRRSESAAVRIPCRWPP